MKTIYTVLIKARTNSSPVSIDRCFYADGRNLDAAIKVAQAFTAKGIPARVQAQQWQGKKRVGLPKFVPMSVQQVDSLPAEVASVTYPAFARFVAGLEHGGDPLDLGARLADDMAAALA